MAYLLVLLSLYLSIANAALPQVDFDRMGKVGLAGAFAGLDLFQNASSAVSFDPSTSTLFSRDETGSLTRLASTNPGGAVLAGCALGNTFYLAGSFSSIGGVSANNVASFNPAANAFSALGSNGPNGEVASLFCDSKNNNVWAGGSFTSPGASVAVWDPKASSWSRAPFVGVTGAQARIESITSNSSSSSIFFAGSFVTNFQGNGPIVLNGTRNPNVPLSPGATPFSSSLVPIPVQNDQINPSSSTSDPQFNKISNILCPAGPDGPGNSWFAEEANTAVVTVRTFTFTNANGIRLGNTFQPNHGTTGFSVVTIPDNKVQTLAYVDPATGQDQTCTDPCPLSTDSTVLYQDFLFTDTLTITGVQIKLSQFTGQSPGLHILQILSSGAFASAVDENNKQSCFATAPSNTTRTGNWEVAVANTDIPGTVQTVLVSTVPVGTPSFSGPTFTWMPYVSASGQYDINLLIPGCTKFPDCPLRTSVKVTVFPGAGLDPWVTTVPQDNTLDAVVPIYSGPIVPSSPNFVTTITMALADNPIGQGQNGNYHLVADRVSFVLKSVSNNSSSSGNSTGLGSSVGGKRGFGFFEWPRQADDDATKVLPNNTITPLDNIAFQLLDGMGGTASSASFIESNIAAVAHHPSGIIFMGGNLTFISGPATGSANIVSFKNGALTPLANNGLNGAVSSLVLVGDSLFVGGSFTDNKAGTSQGQLHSIARYDVQANTWNALNAGVNGPVTSLSYFDGQIQVAGNFTKLLASGSSGHDATGFATWDVKSGSWVNSGGFLAGALTFVGNSTSGTQVVAGNVVAAHKFGASGMIMLQNGGQDGPKITPLGVQLDTTTSTSSSAGGAKKRSAIPNVATWISHVKLSQAFRRQTQSTLALPPALPAPAPAVLSGVFWTNASSSSEVAIIGGNFSFTAAAGGAQGEGVAIYDPQTSVVHPLLGNQIDGVVRSLLVDGNTLYIGGEFTISSTPANGFAIYDLAKQEWDVSNLQALQGATTGNTAVVVRSITKSTAKPGMIVVAGSFAQAGSLRCQAICSLDSASKQWNALGDGVLGEIASVAYAGDDQATLIASGSIALPDNTVANVAQFHLQNATWAAVGKGSDLPGPITAVEVNNGNGSSIFAAGRLSDGSLSYLSFWNGEKWSTLDTKMQGNSSVSQLTMVPLQDTHSANGIIEPDRMLMVSGSLADSSFGDASSALFDGSTFIPYIVATSASGAPGAVASLFRSLASFSFNQRRFLSTGIVILISIAIAAGIVFLLALIGILWTLFSRREDKFEKTEIDDDDDSMHHRPSSLLEHINAATRTTILGASPFNDADRSMEEKSTTGRGDISGEQDPFGSGPDASNYMRAETPSDAVGAVMTEETSRPAHARYSFDGAGEGELSISAGAELEVLDDRDPAWWYARDVRTGREGVVPAAYLY